MTSLGIALLVVGALLAVSEAHNPTHGVAGGLGLAVLAVGAALAISGLGAGVLLGVAGGLVLATAGAGGLVLLVGRGAQARRLRVRTGAEGIIGHMGVVRTWNGTEGHVLVDGALWQARLSPPIDDDDEQPALHMDDRVVVERLNGLTLCVRPAEKWELI